MVAAAGTRAARDGRPATPVEGKGEGGSHAGAAHLVVDVWLLLKLHLDLIEICKGILHLELAVRLRLSRSCARCHGHGASRELSLLRRHHVRLVHHGCPICWRRRHQAHRRRRTARWGCRARSLLRHGRHIGCRGDLSHGHLRLHPRGRLGHTHRRHTRLRQRWEKHGRSPGTSRRRCGLPGHCVLFLDNGLIRGQRFAFHIRLYLAHPPGYAESPSMVCAQARS